MLKYISFCLLLLSGFGSFAQRDTTHYTDEEIEQKRISVQKFFDEFFDIEALDKSLQVRHLAKEQIVKDQRDEEKSQSLQITLFSNLDIPEIWPKALTGKWVYTADGKVKKEYKRENLELVTSRDAPRAAVRLNLIFTKSSDSTRLDLKTSLVGNDYYLECNTKAQTVLDTICKDLDRLFFEKTYTNPKDARVAEALEYLNDTLQKIGGWAYYISYAQKTEALKKLNSDKDLNVLAKQLSNAISSNEQAEKSETKSPQAFNYIFDPSRNILFPLEESETLTRYSLAISEINQDQGSDVYIVAYSSNYAYFDHEINDLADKVLDRVSNVENKNFTLVLVHEARFLSKDSVDIGSAPCIDYATSGNQDATSNYVSDYHSSNIKYGYTTYKNLDAFINNVPCGLINIKHQQNPESDYNVTNNYCGKIHSEENEINYTPLARSTNVDQGPSGHNVVYLTSSGFAFRPNYPLEQIVYDWALGFVYEFNTNGVSYQYIHFSSINDDSHTPIGFTCYLQKDIWESLSTEAWNAIKNNEYFNPQLKAEAFADKKIDLLQTSYKQYVYHDFEKGKIGDTVWQARINSEGNCEKQIIKWALDKNYEASSPFPDLEHYGAFQFIDPPLNNGFQVINTDKIAHEFYCEFSKTRKIRGVGKLFLDQHLKEGLNPLEQKAILRIAEIYDLIGIEVVNDYLKEVNMASDFVSFFQNYNDNRTLALSSGGSFKYRDFLADLEKRYSYFLQLLDQIPKVNDQYETSLLAAKLTDGEIRVLSIDLRKKLLHELSSGSMWAWYNDEEGLVLKLISTIPPEDIPELHAFLIQDVLTFEIAGLTLKKTLLDHLDNEFQSLVSSTNYRRFIEILIHQSLLQLKDNPDLISDILGKWDDPTKVVFWGEKGFDGKQFNIDCNTKFINQNNKLALQVNLSYHHYDYKQMFEDGEFLSSKYASTIDDVQFTNHPFNDFIALITTDDDANYAQGLPPIVPAITLRYLDNEAFYATVRKVISYSFQIVGTIASAGALSAGVGAIRTTIAILDLAGNAASLTADILDDLDLLPKELANDIRKYSFCLNLVSISSYAVPKVAKYLPSTAGRIVAGINGLKGLPKKLMNKLDDFSNQLRGKLLQNGYLIPTLDEAEQLSQALQVARTNFLNYTKGALASFLPGDKQFWDLFKEYATLSIKKGVTDFNNFFGGLPKGIQSKLADFIPAAEQKWIESLLDLRAASRTEQVIEYFSRYEHLSKLDDAILLNIQSAKWTDDIIVKLEADLVNTDLITKINSNHDLVYGWKILSDYTNLRKNVTNLETLLKVQNKFTYNGAKGLAALEELMKGHKSAQNFIDNLDKAEEIFSGVGIKHWSGIKSSSEVRLVNDAGVVIGKVEDGKFTVTCPNGIRPEPHTYLTQNYIDEHLEKFHNEGGAFVVVETWIEKANHKSFPVKKYVMLQSDMRSAINKYKASGRIEDLEDALGYSRGDLVGFENDLYVFYLTKAKFKFQVPDGNELGANSLWKPGSKTSGGYREAVVIDKLNPHNPIVHNNDIESLQTLLRWEKITK